MGRWAVGRGRGPVAALGEYVQKYCEDFQNNKYQSLGGGEGADYSGRMGPSSRYSPAFSVIAPEWFAGFHMELYMCQSFSYI